MTLRILNKRPEKTSPVFLLSLVTYTLECSSDKIMQTAKEKKKSGKLYFNALMVWSNFLSVKS